MYCAARAKKYYITIKKKTKIKTQFSKNKKTAFFVSL